MPDTTYPCPNGHASTDPEYCSECGKKLAGPGVSAIASPTGAPSASGDVCPDCGTPRAKSAVFCEVCRYNFQTQQSWTPDAPVTPAPPAPPAPPVDTPAPALVPDAMPVAAAPPADATPPVVSSAAAALHRWEAVVVVDPSLYVDPDPANPAPVGTPERRFPLDLPENLLGRRSERRAIYPEIDLSEDHGVSSRHAILYREGDGSLSLVDVGSTNGTQLNGTDVAPGVRTPLTVGDQVTLGCWTRITIRDNGAAA